MHAAIWKEIAPGVYQVQLARLVPEMKSSTDLARAQFTGQGSIHQRAAFGSKASDVAASPTTAPFSLTSSSRPGPAIKSMTA
jgi:hypothetical protein